jgi:hypothetical protein
MENFYIVSVVVCLVSYLFLNWYDGMDLSLGDLLMFSMAALVPFVNFLFLVYLAMSTLLHFDLTDIPTITLLRGKE